MSTADCPVCVSFHQTSKTGGSWINLSTLESRLRASCVLKEDEIETVVNVKLVDFREECLVDWMERLRDKRSVLRDMRSFVETKGLVEGKKQLLFEIGIYYMEVTMFGDCVTSYLSTAISASEREKQRAKAYLAALNRFRNPVAGVRVEEEQ